MKDAVIYPPSACENAPEATVLAPSACEPIPIAWVAVPSACEPIPLAFPPLSTEVKIFENGFKIIYPPSACEPEPDAIVWIPWAIALLPEATKQFKPVVIAPMLWRVFEPEIITDPMIVVVLLAESTVRRPPMVTDPLIFPNMFPVTVKSLGMVTVVPDVGWIVFTLNVLMFYFYIILLLI